MSSQGQYYGIEKFGDEWVAMYDIKLRRRSYSMRKLLIGLIAGILLGASVAHAVAPPSDDTLLASIKQAFLAAGWTAPATVTPPSSATKPSQLVGPLWTVTGPFNKPGQKDDPQNEYITTAETDSAFNPYMFMQGGALVFHTPVNGVTTANSDYPRSELREMKDTNWGNASWSNKTGTHTLNVREAITHEPVAKPEVVSAQIHDGSDDIIQVFLQGSKLYVRYNDDNSVALMDGAYILGTSFDLQVIGAAGHIKVSYNGVQKLDWSKSGSGWYWKVGSYCQSNVAHGDAPTAYCEVIVYSLGTVTQ